VILVVVEVELVKLVIMDKVTAEVAEQEEMVHLLPYQEHQHYMLVVVLELQMI